jgi:hypothetical protein
MPIHRSFTLRSSKQDTLLWYCLLDPKRPIGCTHAAQRGGQEMPFVLLTLVVVVTQCPCAVLCGSEGTHWLLSSMPVDTARTMPGSRARRVGDAATSTPCTFRSPTSFTVCEPAITTLRVASHPLVRCTQSKRGECELPHESRAT